MIGKKLSPILEEIESKLLEFDAIESVKPEYTIEGFRAAVYIFMSVMMDKVWELQEYDEISLEMRIKMIEKLGNEMRSLVKTYTNIDTHKLYEL